MAVLGLVGWQFGLKPRQDAQRQQALTVSAVRVARVAPIAFEQTLRVAGSTSSQESVNMTAPAVRGPDVGEMVLQYLVPTGTMVKKGQLMAEIDSRNLQDHIDDIGDTIEQADADIRKRQAEQLIDLESIRQQIALAKAEFDKATLNAQASEVRTAIDQELLRLAVEEAEANYKRAQADVAQKEIVHKAELRILEITKLRHASHRGRHQSDVKRFKMFAPMDGLAVVQMQWRGREFTMIQQGDQLRPGTLFLKVVNPNKMQVEGTVNQSESGDVRIGQKASVTFDAFPGLTLPGHVYSIGALATGGMRQNFYIRQVPVMIAIDQAHEKVIPDLSAAADVKLHREEGKLTVPLGALVATNGKTAVWVRKGQKFERREVELGLRNNTQAIVLSGLKAEEEVALDPPLAASIS
ncbi:MAG: HlyD family efflux transporter periplasmic adaptor subunit [Bryobacteraceae bacterium]